MPKVETLERRATVTNCVCANTTDKVIWSDERRIFAERLHELATSFARQTSRMAGIVRLFGHSAGGRPSERLMARLGMPVGHTTILRRVKERTAWPLSTWPASTTGPGRKG